MEHFLFVCEGHAEPRREWMRKRRRLLTEKEALRWDCLSTEGRLKEVLFPFQERLRRVPENEKQALEEKRMEHLADFMEYVKNTERWRTCEERT